MKSTINLCRTECLAINLWRTEHPCLWHSVETMKKYVENWQKNEIWVKYICHIFSHWQASGTVSMQYVSKWRLSVLLRTRTICELLKIDKNTYRHVQHIIEIWYRLLTGQRSDSLSIIKAKDMPRNAEQEDMYFCNNYAMSNGIAL